MGPLAESKMMSPSELNTFNGQVDDRKFFYLYENVIMKNKSDEEKADNLVTYPTRKAFDFYFDSFTIDNTPTVTDKRLSVEKRLILDRFASKKDTALVKSDAVAMKYERGNVRTFIEKDDRAYRDAGFNEESK